MGAEVATGNCDQQAQDSTVHAPCRRRRNVRTCRAVRGSSESLCVAASPTRCPVQRLVGVGHSPAACGSRLVTVRVLFYDDGHSFLHDAGPLLASDPLRYSVIATNTERPRTSGQPFWFAAVMRDDHSLAGVAMRTHPDPPHAGFVARMPEAAVGALAAALWQRHEVSRRGTATLSPRAPYARPWRAVHPFT